MRDETYPTEIGRFDTWWADKRRRIAEATDEGDIRAVLTQVQAYETHGWVAKGRTAEIEQLAAKRRREWRTGP